MGIQSYCTLDEMIEDAGGAPGLDFTVVGRFIRPASDYLAQTIGQFLPSLETRRFSGRGTSTLFIPPMLRLTGDITNDETVVTASQVILGRNALESLACWENGPYLRIDFNPDESGGLFWVPEINSICIPAEWGLYSKTIDTGADLTEDINTGDYLVSVTDGSKISPGMMLKIDSEWIYVALYGTPTRGVSSLNAALDASAEVFSVADGSLINAGEIIRVNFERMRVIEIQDNEIYVDRGWNRTVKTAHADGAALDVFRNFACERAANGSEIASHTSGTRIYRQTVPTEINYLARQIATLMMKKSQTGYAGRAGNADGETFYNFEFPRDALERIAGNYYLPQGR